MRMNKNKVTQEQINRILDRAEVDIQTVFGKTTIVTAKLANGFVITESSSCVDPKNYDEKLGGDICIKRIMDKLWELEEYMLQEYLYRKGEL